MVFKSPKIDNRNTKYVTMINKATPKYKVHIDQAAKSLEIGIQRRCESCDAEISIPKNIYTSTLDHAALGITY